MPAACPRWYFSPEERLLIWSVVVLELVVLLEEVAIAQVRELCLQRHVFKVLLVAEEKSAAHGRRHERGFTWAAEDVGRLIVDRVPLHLSLERRVHTQEACATRSNSSSRSPDRGG